MHYTPKFKEAYSKVLEALEKDGEEAARLVFREAMLSIGHDERIRNLYRVKDKLSNRAVFFVPNASQERFLKSRSKRNIILKCRQVGFTTLNCIRALDLVLWEPGTKTGILCHKLGTVKTIFNDIIKYCFYYFKKDWGHLYRPVVKADSANALFFESDGLGRSLQSSILVLHDFRGKSLSFLHVSEASRIEDDRLVGSLNSVSDAGEITLESTAYGRSGEFYRLWQLWREKRQLAPYKGFFVPWYVHYPEPGMEVPVPKDIKWSLRELELLEGYKGKITPEKLAWRRWAIEAKCVGSEERFENEYPTNDIDCFLSSEHSVFPRSILKLHLNHVKDPFFQGFLVSDGKRMSVQPDPKGPIAIWEEPDPSHAYVIGADPAGGVGKDMAAAYVKDQQTGKLVARIWGDLIPADFAKELWKLAKFYNNAYICIEVNNHGHTVLHILSEELSYKSLYRRTVLDQITKSPTKKLGFRTTNESKILITENLKTALKNGKLIVQDSALISQMSNFVQTASKTGAMVRRQAAGNGHDDLVMAAAFTEEMSKQRPNSAEDPIDPDIPEQVFVDPETGFVTYG